MKLAGRRAATDIKCGMSNEAMVKGAFLGDAISLGPHWIYDQEEIARKIPHPDRFNDPVSKYHPGKKAGDFTHYGDQMLVLLRHLAEVRSFDLPTYAKAWEVYWKSPDTISYCDGSTKGTLANLGKGIPPEKAGSESHDLAGASKIAPLFLLQWQDDEALVAACRSLTAFTHRTPDVIAASEFFARVALAVGGGEAIDRAIRRLGDDLGGNARDWLSAAERHHHSPEGNTRVLQTHGLSCDVDGGFTGVCHLLLRYPDDGTIALVENAKAGGDSAARGMILGMIYGAADVLAFPGERESGFNAREEIDALIGSLSSGL